ncbi:major facilitator superfamily MFS-1 [Grosmannia clavigera kw1407]|uniref:Major facilitator superfamily MFS-1 n=1 Tax=Grosmannia clavigera (strain kw1407 / UAMH 11150) TaxID=655863 RepID=F0XND1_GROCL|nr:major facilitator superfamily MFS-1 [Grosmannia clavigera kw1407]EFX00902.1 major facilitator superfamily MFS-1 [Grosmannia clavigera kw1407]
MAVDMEKHAVEGDTYAVKPETTLVEDAMTPEFTLAEQKSIMRRVDRRLVTTVGFMYCVSLMDRTNLGAANIAGLAKDLKLTVGARYSIISLVFFVPYIICQAPSTVIVRKVGPRLHLSLITVCWGAVMVGMGFVPTWEALAGLRVILGIFEAGFFPSCIYLLSTWYTRFEVGKRNAAFYILGCVASAFAAILAAGIMQMKGLAGLNGWRWIFITEGYISCLIGIAGFWLLVDFPDSKRKIWNFLGDRERAWVVARVNADRGDAVIPPFKLSQYFRSGLDWKVWAYAMIFFSTTTITYALSYFLPVILQENMGFTTVQAQCLIAPPYVFAGLVMFSLGYIGDRYKVRGPLIVFCMLLCLIGLPIVGFHPNSGVRYFGIFLVTAGANSNVPCIMSYQANNIRGQWKRAFASATLVGFGGLGGVCGSLVFREQDKPGYRPGIYACIAVSLVTLLLVCALSLDYRSQNRKADRGEKELETLEDGYLPGFRYTL